MSGLQENINTQKQKTKKLKFKICLSIYHKLFKVKAFLTIKELTSHYQDELSGAHYYTPFQL